MSIERPPRAWQRMLSGRRLDLLDPAPLDVEIEDVALGLSRVARWNGQTVGEWPFSVAQHSVLVEELARRIRPGMAARWRLAALLHDAPEYVLGDLITPFKAAIGDDYKALERRLLTAVHVRFGLPGEPPADIAAVVKRADRTAAYLEATRLAGFEAREAARYFGKPRDVRRLSETLPLAAWPPERARAAFLERFHALVPQPVQRSPR